jgi:hypothetical protein
MGIVRHVLFFDAVSGWHLGPGLRAIREKIILHGRIQSLPSPVWPLNKGILFSSGHTGPSAFSKQNLIKRLND